MPKIAAPVQRFLVHELMLEHHRADAPLPRHDVLRRVLLDIGQRVEDRAPHPITVRVDVGQVGPAVRHFRVRVHARGIFHVGVDPTIEDLVEGRLERGLPEHAATDVVPRERRQMTDVEDERVTQRDRPVEDRVGRHQPEQRVRAHPRGFEAIGECLRHASTDRHGVTTSASSGTVRNTPDRRVRPSRARRSPSRGSCHHDRAGR